MAYKPTPNEFNNNYPVAGWNRNTVADGNWLNNNTIKPLQERDVFLLELINEKADEYETRDAEASLNESFNNLKQEIEDTFSLSAGHNIRIDEDPDGKTLTINAIDTPTDKFVTSAINTFEDGKSYTLEKNGNTTKWVGYDLSDIGKTYYEGPNIKITDDYHISGRDWDPELDNLKQYVDDEIQDIAQDVIDLTQDLSEFESEVEEDLSECVTSADFTFENGLSYVLEKDGDNNPTWVGYDLNDIGGKVNILGNNGVSAGFDESTDTWKVGLSANNFAYLYDTYTNGYGDDVNANTILYFSGTNHNGISVDEDGYITLPESGNKFTFCINEYVDNNINPAANFLLNKLTLSSDKGDNLATTLTYYPAEAGASNASLSITVDHSVDPTRKYAVVYEGSTVPYSAYLNASISIVEEVANLGTITRDSNNYVGDRPIIVNNDSRHIDLDFDPRIFTLKDGTTLTLNADGGEHGDEPVDPVAFNKLLNSINGRIVESLPIGSITNASNINAGNGYAYLFRPSIEFDMSQETKARIVMFEPEGSDARVSVGIYLANEDDQGASINLSLIWNSELTTPNAGTTILNADSNTPGGTIYPDKLYYVTLRVPSVGGKTQGLKSVLGIPNNFNTDIGKFDLAYGGLNIFDNVYPLTITSESREFSDTSHGTFKPYIAFRNDEV